MSVSLTANFFSNARGLTISNGGGIAWTFNKNTNTLTATGSGGAVLSSVGLADLSGTPIFTITNSPLIANGTIGITLNNQAKNTFFAGPSSGANAQPAFRGIAVADLPTGIPNANLANSAVTVTAGAGLSGGGSVSLGGSVTLANAGVTSIGSSNLAIGGSTATPTVNLSSTQVTNIGLGGTALQTASVADSITGNGTSGSPLQLSGDSASPGNSYYYGTNGSGTKGWYANETGANPSASIGLSAVNGTASTWMRSDAAPALSQAIVPTWTGQHTFNSEINLASGQIQFPSSQNASSNAQTLDDYQELTWTPTFSNLAVVNGTGGATYSGTLLKIGKLVYFTVLITVTGTCTTSSTTGVTTVTNLPYTAGAFSASVDATDIVSIVGFPGGMIYSGTKTLFPPSWSARNDNVIISGTYQATA